uniref:Polymorphic transmembrane cluster 2 transmembrane protein 11 n=1 Tax=Biomphalaria glabrata TaxID=6526 RepID=A0A7G8ZAX7_BIOGL|nr:polymorphic transmembrane cluster 2 transmembrane protein 11 [Biomphalaria glabrata]
MVGYCEVDSVYVCKKNNQETINAEINFNKNSTEDQYIITIESRTTSKLRNMTSKKFYNEVWRISLGLNALDSKTCDIKFYAIFDDPECFPNISMEHFILTCFLRRVFPEALCDFDIILNNTDSFVGSIDYKQTEIDDGAYYKTSCTLSAMTSTENGKYQITVTMYPNINGIVSDRKYGKSITIFYPERLLVIKDLNKTVLDLIEMLLIQTLKVRTSLVMMTKTS